MKRKILIPLLTAIHLVFFSYCYAESTLNCGKNIVSVGDAAYDVLMKCEKPKWVDASELDVIKELNPNEWVKSHIKRELWLYNRGPNTFMKELIFENDKLVEIKSLSYGCLEKDIGSFANDDNKLHLRMSKPEVLIFWGNPDYQTDMTEERLYKVSEKEFLKYTISISKWIYNFGENRFIKTLVFENGRLTEIIAGERGYGE
ncbi:MAG: DUF2845 domain-containing protein [Proteobacteria bacterium]|nr:DUF2845 domain-containing protein [Pseudomonadota bacterium]